MCGNKMVTLTGTTFFSSTQHVLTKLCIWFEYSPRVNVTILLSQSDGFFYSLYSAQSAQN